MRRGAALSLCLALLALAGPAQAAQRYASPSGTGPSAECPQAKPCSLEDAIEGAKANDEVIVGGGTYTSAGAITSEVTADDLYVHGDFSGPTPRINTSAPFLYGIALTGPGSRLAYLDVSNTGDQAKAVACVDGVTVERVRVSGSGEAAGGLIARGTCTVRDSVALADGPKSIGLHISGEAGGTTTVMRNVTAIATGTGSRGVLALCGICSPAETINLDIKNTITSGTGADLETGPSATIVASHSNFDKAVPITPGSIVDAGGNQTAPPTFVDGAGGNYREAVGSPTIDAGVADQLGTTDFDGSPRVLGTAPDIGAFEFAPPPVAPVVGEIQSLSLTRRKFTVANIGGAILSARKKATAPIATTVAYSLSAAATVTFTVERRLPGRKIGKRCVKQTKANRTKKKCSRFKPLKGSFNHSGQAGANSFKFSGRLNGKGLKPGSYRLVGKTGSASRAASFRIVK
jgi:hypothetical protein